LIGIGTVGLLSYNNFFSNQLITEENSLQASNKKVTFPDGSTAYLNNKALVNFPNTFGKSNRLINMKGEAFFNIRSNASKPFVIKAENARIEVLGTSFNVRVNDKDNVEVLVKSGSVKLSSINDKKNFVILNSGYLGIISKNEVKKVENTNKNYISWLTKKLYFKDTHLHEVAKTLERTYNVKIAMEQDIDAKTLSLTATFNEESIDYILEVISKTFDIQVKKQNNNKYLLTN
jgi:ferric-dicitrate binding protein FerR (iron transport regulator)